MSSNSTETKGWGLQLGNWSPRDKFLWWGDWETPHGLVTDIQEPMEYFDLWHPLLSQDGSHPSPTTSLFSQDCFPMVQQHGPSEESLRLTTMLFATCSSFSQVSLLYALMAHQLPCSSLQNLSLWQACVMVSHTVAKALPIPGYEMPPMLRSQARDSTNPFSLFSDSSIC